MAQQLIVGDDPAAHGEPPPNFMLSRSRILPRLRETLTSILEGKQTRAQVNQFVNDCTAIALTLVQSKIASGSLQLHRFGLRASDIAFDAIADLFREGEDGTLVQIRVYFESVQWENFEDEELLIHLRRLVFMRTNQGLFRMYNELDPGLGKILRNTKLAIAALNTFVEVDRFGEPCIAPAHCSQLERLPMVDRDSLERRIVELTNGSERIPAILAKLSRYLREQNTHSRMVPILWVAYAIRSAYGRSQSGMEQHPEGESNVVEEDLRRLLAHACAGVKEENRKHYERVGKDLYDSYFAVIEQIVVKRLVSNDGHDVSLYKLLCAKLPGLSREEYNASHKAKLEYLARLAEEKAVAVLKKDLLR